ncbi:MAG: enoyl-CoA hydratase/isomerase family protein [Bacteroidia bacterium]|nr:enoyl-CoA hydratase/isomerase family protein [Bacteroidia bacterium]
MNQFIQYQLQDGVAIITLNRPEKFHSFIRPMATELQQALDKAANDKNTRAILLTATGKAFCAGQDLSEAIDPNGPGIVTIVEESYNAVIKRLRFIEKPIICAVNGIAAGAGANIALACDIVLAAKSAAFIQAFSKIGLIPDSGGTFILPRLIGWQRAAALMFTAEKVSADEAEQMGMIYQSVADEELEKTALSLAKQLAQMPTVGIGLTKRLLNESMHNSLAVQLQREGAVQAEAANSYDHKEGVKAFLEKRLPAFKGE